MPLPNESNAKSVATLRAFYESKKKENITLEISPNVHVKSSFISLRRSPKVPTIEGSSPSSQSGAPILDVSHLTRPEVAPVEQEPCPSPDESTVAETLNQIQLEQSQEDVTICATDHDANDEPEINAPASSPCTAEENTVSETTVDEQEDETPADCAESSVHTTTGLPDDTRQPAKGPSLSRSPGSAEIIDSEKTLIPRLSLSPNLPTKRATNALHKSNRVSQPRTSDVSTKHQITTKTPTPAKRSSLPSAALLTEKSTTTSLSSGRSPIPKHTGRSTLDKVTKPARIVKERPANNFARPTSSSSARIVSNTQPSGSVTRQVEASKVRNGVSTVKLRPEPAKSRQDTQMTQQPRSSVSSKHKVKSTLVSGKDEAVARGSRRPLAERTNHESS